MCIRDRAQIVVREALGALQGRLRASADPLRRHGAELQRDVLSPRVMRAPPRRLFAMYHHSLHRIITGAKHPRNDATCMKTTPAPPGAAAAPRLRLCRRCKASGSLVHGVSTMLEKHADPWNHGPRRERRTDSQSSPPRPREEPATRPAEVLPFASFSIWRHRFTSPRKRLRLSLIHI